MGLLRRCDKTAYAHPIDVIYAPILATAHASRDARGMTRRSAIALDHLPVLAAVAHEGSFALAARRLGVDRSRVSRVIGEVEAALGTVLFMRTTRAVRLTAEGAALLDQVAPALATIARALEGASDAAEGPRGTVVVTASPEVARGLVAPLLPGFRRSFPGVQVQLVASDAVLDLARHGVDLALRLGRQGTASGVARRLGTVAAGFFAAPTYLERRGVPRALGDLVHHDGLWPTPPRGTAAFDLGHGPPPPAAITADFASLAAVARAGGGVALLPTFLAAEDVEAGRLVRVLAEVAAPKAALYLVARPERPRPARTAALHRWLVDNLAV